MATHCSILAGQFHGQRSLGGYSPGGRKEHARLLPTYGCQLLSLNSLTKGLYSSLASPSLSCFMCMEHVFCGLLPKSVCLFFIWGNRGPEREWCGHISQLGGGRFAGGQNPGCLSGVGRKHRVLLARESLLCGRQCSLLRLPSRLRASDHLGSGTGLSGFRCGTRP